MGFADGVSFVAEWWRDGEDVILKCPSYRTAKGTTVEPHRWRLTRKADGTWRSDRDAGCRFFFRRRLRQLRLWGFGRKEVSQIDRQRLEDEHISK